MGIADVVQKSRDQRTEILLRKESGEAADVISGRIFESMEKPHDSPEYVYRPENLWLMERAHRGSIDQIIFCKHRPPIVLTLGFDQRVCAWDPKTGEALGTLEQGLAEGLSYERLTKWRFPIDAQDQVKKDLAALQQALLSPPASESDEKGSEGKDVSEEGSQTKEEAYPGAQNVEGGSKPGSQKGGSDAGGRGRKMSRSESSPAGLGGAAAKLLRSKTSNE